MKTTGAVPAFVLILGLFTAAEADENDVLPSYVDVCYRDDPKVGQCIKQAIGKLVPMFKAGSADFDLQPLDPMALQDFEFSFSSTLIGGNMKGTKAGVKGLSKIQVIDVSVTSIDWYSYSLHGNVLTLGVDMKGHIEMDFIYVTVTYTLNADVQKINNREFLNLKSFYWRFNGDSMKDFRVVNNEVVDGRPVLNTLVLTILRTAWRPLMNAMLPSFLKSTGKSLTDAFTKFFKKYPYDVLFPKRKG